MAGKDEYRIFVGGLSSSVSERQLESAFSRYGKILETQNMVQGNPVHLALMGNSSKYIIQIFCLNDCLEGKIMLERDTGRPRGFGFLTFADRRGMEDAIREMHGHELGERTITVNKAEPKMEGDNSEPGFRRGGYSSGGRASFGRGGDRSVGQDECFKCGRPGHWARDCPSAGGGRGRGGDSFSLRSRFDSDGRGDRFGEDRDRYIDDRYDLGRDGGRYGDRDRFDRRDDKYGSRDRYFEDRYPSAGDRFAGGDRYDVSDRYPQNGYAKDRGSYGRDIGPRSGSDRYGSGGPGRYEGRSLRDRPGPYDRPSRGGRPSSYERY